jgi:hypothetical protein
MAELDGIADELEALADELSSAAWNAVRPREQWL